MIYDAARSEKKRREGASRTEINETLSWLFMVAPNSWTLCWMYWSLTGAGEGWRGVTRCHGRVKKGWVRTSASVRVDLRVGDWNYIRRLVNQRLLFPATRLPVHGDPWLAQVCAPCKWSLQSLTVLFVSPLTGRLHFPLLQLCHSSVYAKCL